MYIVDIHLIWKISDSVNIRGHVFFTSYHCTAQRHQLNNAHLALAWRSSNSSEFGLPRDAASERSGFFSHGLCHICIWLKLRFISVNVIFSSHEGLRNIVKQHGFMFAKLSPFLRSCRSFRPLSRMLTGLITSRVIFSHFLMSLFSPQHSLKEHLHNSHCPTIAAAQYQQASLSLQLIPVAETTHINTPWARQMQDLLQAKISRQQTVGRERRWWLGFEMSLKRYQWKSRQS